MDAQANSTSFQTIPGSNNEDAIGLGGSSLQCAKKQYPHVLQDFVDLSNNSNNNQQLTAYQTCIRYIWSSGLRLEDAYQSWEDKRYSEAANPVNSAFDDYWQCVTQLEDAYRTWEHKSNSEAADRVNAALDDYWHCAIQLSTNSVINLQQLVRALTNFKIFMEVSIEIIRQL
ncbi:hypothetical protein ACH5RR_003718 [Cinchona calisaya]|uniref:Uncharacterized protein n=1 Tax=Cinchona calisaya TaxID=153742 RepID=A0ABD3AWB4_9GENT